ncbi:MAG: ATPase domain-containing protein [Candidatus Woesearchaeota archaeon]
MKKHPLLKSEKMHRTPTGIPGFDKIIEGGLVTKSVNLISGDAGTSKSIFCTQYLINGIVKYNEPGLYVSFGERKENVYKEMKLFGWDLEKLEKQGKFMFLEYTPEQVENVIRTGGGIISDVVLSINAKRVVIDSITAITLLYESAVVKRAALLELFDLIRRWNCTALLISESPQVIGQHHTTMEEFQVDGDILMYNVMKNNRRQLFLEVFKMRATCHSRNVYKIIIAKDGLRIEDVKHN